MKINLQGVTNQSSRQQWEEKKYTLPQYDIEQVAKATRENPFWIHFGAGNLFRAFHAVIAQNLLNAGKLDRGILVAEGFDYEIIEKMYTPHDNLGIAVTLKADGTIDKQVIGSVAQALPLDSKDDLSFARLKGIFANASLQLATFTITEKGYSLTDAKGDLLPDVAADFAAGPEKPASYMGKVSALLYARYCAGEKPIAMVSTDNCSHNGDKLYAAVSAFAKAWVENGKADTGFLQYIDSKKVSFPWSMIDKITPRPDASVEKILQEDGVEELDPVITSKNTYVAPFVNAEETEYLVIEDDFPNGRPALEEGGILFTDRATVDKVEKMKVCTCLNPLHTCLAIFGCLLGYHKISDEMQDPELVKLVERVGYQEGLPVVVNPGILNPREFIDTVLKVRVTNPFMPDTPQRIATDTSQKLAIRFGETIKAYQTGSSLSVEDLQMIPLVLAGWLRYLMAVDDGGEAFELSPDPLLETLRPQMTKLKLGDTQVEAVIRPIMENAAIFGVNLYEVGMADRVCSYFTELIEAPGAVRRTLKKYLTP
ncbi:MAG: mannitol dehydrogenase family protein [Lachnospiraceae bacterium]|nr:mannitol dehydrogenase family protein [Lachnospiraceae bacterium]